MVRQKNRWLLVKLDFEEDILSACAPGGGDASSASATSGKKRKLHPSSSNISAVSNASSSHALQQQLLQVTATDVYRSLQESILQNFGVVGAATMEIRVLLYDPKLRLAIVKTSRDKYPLVRSAITLLAAIRQGGDTLKVAASTVAVSGSARTARNAAWEYVQKEFYGRGRSELGIENGEPWSTKGRAAMEKELRALEARMEKIDAAC
ncbi:hypothetical protein ACHAXT_007198 [Thalassiosira profunda]